MNTGFTFMLFPGRWSGACPGRGRGGLPGSGLCGLAAKVLVQRAIDRGEIPAGTDADVVLDLLFGSPMPYIAAWQQAPVRGPAARAEFALHLQVIPVGRAPGEVKFLAGTESAAGVWSNDTLPEVAASALREVGR